MQPPTNALAIDDIASVLDSAGLKYRRVSPTSIRISFGGLHTYRDPNGAARVELLIELRRDRLRIVAPSAWQLADEAHWAAVSETCHRIQSEHSGIRFELCDPQVGVSVSSEFHQRSPSGGARVLELLLALVDAVEAAHPPIRAAVDDGRVWDGMTHEDRRQIDQELAGELAAALTSDQLRKLLDVVRESTPG